MGLDFRAVSLVGICFSCGKRGLRRRLNDQYCLIRDFSDCKCPSNPTEHDHKPRSSRSPGRTLKNWCQTIHVVTRFSQGEFKSASLKFQVVFWFYLLGSHPFNKYVDKDEKGSLCPQGIHRPVTRTAVTRGRMKWG